jgi:hypothetical protein
MPSAARYEEQSPSPDDGRVVCPTCQRPSVSVRATLCIYCGQPLNVKVRPSVEAEKRAALAEEFAAMSMPPSSGPSLGGINPWVVRIGGIGVGALLVFGLLGPCMNR